MVTMTIAAIVRLMMISIGRVAAIIDVAIVVIMSIVIVKVFWISMFGMLCCHREIYQDGQHQHWIVAVGHLLFEADQGLAWFPTRRQELGAVYPKFILTIMTYYDILLCLLLCILFCLL